LYDKNIGPIEDKETYFQKLLELQNVENAQMAAIGIYILHSSFFY
jgi:hypothetical protein